MGSSNQHGKEKGYLVARGWHNRQGDAQLNKDGSSGMAVQGCRGRDGGTRTGKLGGKNFEHH